MRSKDPNFISLGDVCREQLGMQCQYGSRYADPVWSDEYPDCGKGLRIQGNSDMYHDMTIHRDDVETFVTRVRDHVSKR